MQGSQRSAAGISAAESWQSIHQALESRHRSLYMAGSAAILLLWGAIMAVYFLATFAIGELAPEFVAAYPWYHGPVWALLGPLGMIGSAIIGHRAGERNADPATARNAGIRVFLYWLAVALAAGLLPGVAGLWDSDLAENIPRTVLGVIFLGYVLFGILFRPALAVVGAALVAAVLIPHYFAGDWAGLITGLGVLAVCGAGAAWIRRSGLL